MSTRAFWYVPRACPNRWGWKVWAMLCLMVLRWDVTCLRIGFIYIYKKQEMKINNVSLWFFKHICFEHHWTLCLMSRNLIWYVLGPQNIYFTYPQVLFVWRNCALTIGCFGTGSWVFMCRFFSWSSCARRWFNWKHWTGEVISEMNIFVFDYV